MVMFKAPRRHYPRTAKQQAQFKKFASAGGKASAAARRGKSLGHTRKSTAGQPRSAAQKAAFALARAKGAKASAAKRRGTHYHLKHPRKKKAVRKPAARRTSQSTGIRVVARFSKPPRFGFHVKRTRQDPFSYRAARGRSRFSYRTPRTAAYNPYAKNSV